MEHIQSLVNALKATYNEGKTRTLQFRKQQLKNLEKGFQALEEEFNQAKQKDLGVNPFITYLTESVPIHEEIKYNLNNLSKWMKPLSLETPALLAPGSSSIIYEPLGVIGIIGAWNFPIVTCMGPLISAISAGNAIILKPSEMAEETSKVFSTLFTYLDSSLYRVIQGGADMAKAICSSKLDGIVFTGSPEKGRLVAQAAATNLVPCLLELGGKNPAIIDQGANVEYAASKISLGRFINHGQLCIAPDYVMVHRKIRSKFIPALLKAMKEQWGNIEIENNIGEMGKAINEFHIERVLNLIKSDHGGEILTGGKGSLKERYIQPTVIESPRLDSELMQCEVFGPVLSILYYDHISEAVSIIQSKEKPMVCYYFGPIFRNSVLDILKRDTSSGCLCVNDVINYALSSEMPFGGVGNSGTGKYKGIYGFQNLSNAKNYFIKPSLNFFPLNVMTPPFTKESKKKTIKFLVRSMKGTQSMMLKVFFVLFMLFVMFLYSFSQTMITPFCYLLGYALMIFWTILFLFL